MIKEKKKITKYNRVKTKAQVVIEYVRTFCISILISIVITSSLAIHARNEMIKNIYLEADVKRAMDKETALKLINQSNLLEDISTKKYSVCMHIAELYEAAGDYKDAKFVYEQAIIKTTPKNYNPYYRLLCVLLELDDFNSANALIENIKDYNNKELIKFKSRSYLTIGDKYYSKGKFLSAAKMYEKANYYYSKFSKKDKKIAESINNRIVNSYIEVADIMVKSGLNSDAIRFLKKAESYDSQNYTIRYKLAIVLSDSDPEKSVEYLDELLEEIPQEIDYSIYGTALMKSANIADLDNRPTQAKYYRYKIHSIDMFVNRKVVYKNDFDVVLHSFKLKKEFFRYPLKATYSFLNVSNMDVINMYADFVLLNKNKPVETITQKISNKNKPLLSYSYEPNFVDIKFVKRFFTKKELENYTIKVYLYKDEKYKTLVSETAIPLYSF